MCQVQGRKLTCKITPNSIYNATYNQTNCDNRLILDFDEILLVDGDCVNKQLAINQMIAGDVEHIIRVEICTWAITKPIKVKIDRIA